MSKKPMAKPAFRINSGQRSSNNSAKQHYVSKARYLPGQSHHAFLTVQLLLEDHPCKDYFRDPPPPTPAKTISGTPPKPLQRLFQGPPPPNPCKDYFRDPPPKKTLQRLFQGPPPQSLQDYFRDPPPPPPNPCKDYFRGPPVPAKTISGTLQPLQRLFQGWEPTPAKTVSGALPPQPLQRLFQGPSHPPTAHPHPLRRLFQGPPIPASLPPAPPPSPQHKHSLTHTHLVERPLRKQPETCRSRGILGESRSNLGTFAV